MTKDYFLKKEAEGISHRNVRESTCKKCGRIFEWVWIPQLPNPEYCMPCVIDIEKEME